MKVQEVTPKPSQAREKILETALKLFYSRGIRATGIDLIIAESEVAKMTFYKHFPSKQQLVLEVLKRGEAIWRERFQKFVDPIKDPKSKMLAIFDFAGAWFKDPTFRGCAYINTTIEAADPGSQECLAAIEHKKLISRFVEAQAREAGYSEKVAKDLGKKFLLLFDGAIVRAFVDQSPATAQQARAIAETLLAVAAN